MNRLIIIGNGFDLAHGMKTSYKDFLLWYFKTAVEKSNDITEQYEDSLIFVKRDPKVRIKNQFDNIEDYLWFLDIFDRSEQIVYRRNILKTRKINPLIVMEKDYNPLTNERYEPFIIKFRSEFFEGLVKKCSEYNWVDVENEYYKELKAILSLPEKNSRLEKTKNLHSDFQKLIDQFKIFISQQRVEKKIEEFSNLLQEEIYLDDISKSDKDSLKDRIEIGIIEKKVSNGKEAIIPVDTLILNFNYTNTASKYLHLISRADKYDEKFIHKKNEQEIIFGFGDELDEDYKRIELENENEYMRFIKSFGYFENSSYRDLIRFIDSEIFEVFIWGHSCGLSDRTLLNMIFEHENCKLIKIFYHKKEDGTDNYTTLTQEISRHFKDKGMMRKKILSKDKSMPLPQAK